MAKKRKGMTLIETVVALMLMGMAVVVMQRLTSMRIAQEDNLLKEIEVQSADAFMYGIYTDYHNCDSMEISHVRLGDTLPSGAQAALENCYTRVTFNLGSAGTHVYEYQPFTRKAYLNGSEQFNCYGFTVSGSKQHLYVGLKISENKSLEYDLYP